MTISIAPARNEYTANAAQTIFNYTFKIFQNTDLNVYVTPSGQDANDSTDLTTAYTVTGLGDEDGGTIILSAGANVNDLVTIVSNVPSSRTIDYQNNGDFRPETVNDDFDRVVSIVKKIEDTANRTALLQQSQQDPKPLTLPKPTANKFIRWKGDETGFENVDPAEISPEIIDKKDIAVLFDNITAMKIGNLDPGQVATTKGDAAIDDGFSNDYIIFSPQALGVNDELLNNGNVAVWQTRPATQSSYDNALSSLSSSNVQEAITELNLASEKIEQIRKAKSLFKINTRKGLSPWGLTGPINNLGDSISHGAFAIDTFYKGWKSIMARMVNAEFGGQSYDGFLPLLALGTGGPSDPVSADIHGIGFFGTWSSNDQTTANGQASYNGITLFTTTVTDSIISTVPTFQTHTIVWYLQQPGGGEITIYMNGVSPIVINTDGALSMQSQIVTNVDNGTGNCAIKVEKTDATTNPVDVCGFGYVNDTLTPCMHNFSNSGRRLRYVAEQTIKDLTSNATALFLSLGINDAFDAENDPAGYGAEFTIRINQIIAEIQSSGAYLVVNDFCWTYSEDNYVRKELKRAALETGGLYIPLPSMIIADGSIPTSSYLINTLDMWYDQSHPNPQGHKWIAETVAKHLSLTCTSAQDAWANFDYWIPFDIPTGTLNASTSPGAVSAYKTNGDNLLFRYYVKDGGAVSPMPIANYQLQTGWRNFTSQPPPFIGVKGNNDIPGVINNGTSAFTSNLNIAETGGLLLRVTASYIISQRGNGSIAIEMLVN